MRQGRVPAFVCFVLVLCAIKPMFPIALASEKFDPGPCPISYSSLEAAPKFESIIRHGFGNVSLDGASSSIPMSSVSMETMTPAEIAESALRLKKEDRERLLEQVRSAPVAEGRHGVREFVKLALYDEKTWDGLLATIRSYQLTPDWKVAIQDLIASAPKRIKDRVQFFISQNYADAVNAKNSGLQSGQNGVSKFAKNGFDFILRHLHRHEAQIRDTVASGREASYAYDGYLRMVQESLGFSGSKRYGARVVLDVAVAIRSVLASMKPDDEIILAGSFANGRAIPGVSDIDLFSRKTGGVFPAEVDKELGLKIKEVLHKHQLSRMKVSRTEHGDSSVARLSEVSPVALRVRPDRIDLLVYPPQPGAGTVEAPGFGAPEIHNLVTFPAN